jgi:antitoxin component of RelBE/YafQ-DinJ toxin-antitoxin module
MGIDFTGKIQQITSTYDFPMEFDQGVSPEMVRRYLNHFGPMYLFELDGKKYIYQNRGDYDFFMDEEGFDYVDNEIPEKLGIDIMGLRFSDIIDMYFNEEETLNESTDKNKRFLTNHMGIDFTGKFKKITKAFDVPYNFYRNGGISLSHAMWYLNDFGPMYFFELGDYEYLYQDRGGKDWFIDERGVKYTKDEFSKRLGIDVMGLRFSDLIRIYFNEGEPLNENVDKKKRLFTKLLGEDVINSIREITSPNQLPIEFLKSIGTSVIQRYIDVYGPLYYFVLDGEEFLYKERISPRGEEYEMYITNKGKSYLDGEITDRLGLSDMGLNFSDVIDTIFNEEDDVITEDENKELRNRIQRRLGTIDQYIGEMDPNDVCDYWTKGEVDYYVVSSMQNVVEKICDEIGSYDLYDEIYEYISNQGYKSYFKDFFFDTINNYCTEQKHN